MKAYNTTRGTRFAKRDEIVFPFLYCDYGCANDDTRWTGEEYISVTREPDGGYPFFTIPRSALEEIYVDN